MIAAYLARLRRATSGLEDGDDIVAEAEDHLVSAVEAGIARGLGREEAEAEALRRYGDAAAVGQSFVEEAKRGGAVSTTLTRAAGAAAMVAVPAGALAALGVAVTSGALQDGLLVLLGAAFAALGFGLWGARVRHSGLGWWGRAASVVFVAAPFVAFAGPWRTAPALAVLLSVAAVLAGVGMLRAAILPRAALWAFTLAPPVTVAAALAWDLAAGPGAGRDLGWLVTSPGSPEIRAVVLVGLATVGAATFWMGWAMWREPALDARRSRRGQAALDRS